MLLKFFFSVWLYGLSSDYLIPSYETDGLEKVRHFLVNKYKNRSFFNSSIPLIMPTSSLSSSSSSSSSVPISVPLPPSVSNGRKRGDSNASLERGSSQLLSKVCLLFVYLLRFLIHLFRHRHFPFQRKVN